MSTTEAPAVDAVPAQRAGAHASLSSDVRFAVNRLSRTLRAQKADSSMTDVQFSALAQLQRHGPQSLAQLSEHEGVRPPSMTKTVATLMRAGLVTKAGDVDDRRKVLLSVTEAGSAVVIETRRRRDSWLTPRLAQLTPAERRTLAEATGIMRKLAQS